MNLMSQSARLRTLVIKIYISTKYTVYLYLIFHLVNLDKTMDEYEKEWRFIDELGNLHENPYMDWITEDKFVELHKEVRLEADKLMRLEYELLRMALAQDQKTKYKAPRKPKDKKKKGKRKKKKKKVVDVTGDKTLAELYDEMTESGLICSYPKNRLEDYIGDLNFCAYELRNFMDQ